MGDKDKEGVDIKANVKRRWASSETPVNAKTKAKTMSDQEGRRMEIR
jgi:hypothetical protein